MLRQVEKVGYGLLRAEVRTEWLVAVPEDYRLRPPGAVADFIIDQVTAPTNQVVPVQLVFEAADMVKAFYVQPRKKVGAAQAIKALNLKLQSDSPLRVSHCIVTLDLLYRNCGLPFQETIYEDLQPCFQFYSQLVVPDKQSKMTPECRTQFLDMLAGWVSLDSVHQIPKLHGLCAELVTKGYPFSKAGLAKMPEVPPGNHDYFRLPNYEVQLKKVNDAKTPDGKSGFFNFFKK